MKKIIGVLGVAVIALAMFLGVNSVNSSARDTDLASLIAVNTANAEVTVVATGCVYTDMFSDTCTHNNYAVVRCYRYSGGTTCGYNLPN